MRRDYLILFCVCSFSTMFSQNLNYKINLTYIDVSKNNIQSYSSGDKKVSFKNHYLLDILSEIYGISMEYFILKGNATNPKVNLEIKASGKIKIEYLQKELTKYLKKIGLIEVSIIQRKRQISVASHEDKRKMPVSNNANYYNKISQTNKTWKGENITTSTLIDKLKEWYNVGIINELDTINRYNFTIQDIGWNDLKEEIRQEYGVYFKEETRLIDCLQINYLKK